MRVFEKKKLRLKDLSTVGGKIAGLNTVCRHARCPNISECFSKGHLTFMIAGSICTRRCLFCSVSGGVPEPPDPSEPRRVAEAARRLKLKHAVLTSPTRDDLEDGGAAHFTNTVKKLKGLNKGISVEILIPDFSLDRLAIKEVSLSGADIAAHNMETVRRLYSIRPQASYRRSLKVLEALREFNPELKTKSGFMLGLGEKKEEVMGLMRDILDTGCSLLSIGQYLRPSAESVEVRKYLEEDEFLDYKEEALNMGFRVVMSGTYVRSSYMAQEYLV